MEEDFKTIPARLLRYKISNNISSKELAKKWGFGNQTLIDIQNEKGKVSAKTKMRLLMKLEEEGF